MAEYSLLIADSSEEFRRAMAEKLEPFCNVTLCGTGRQVLQQFRLNPPEVLLMDLMLPDLDGISLLEAVLSSGCRPGILAFSSYISPYILGALEGLGVDCLLERPCDLNAAAEQAKLLLRKAELSQAADIRGRISALLLRLGFSAKLRGYMYLREAIFQMVLNSDRSIVKELYTMVGLRYGITAKLVEHSIRGAIQEAWQNRDPGVWNLYFAPNRSTRPTSAALIHTLAQRIRPEGQDTQKEKACCE